MRYITNLMDRIFSDSTPEEFKDKVSEKIEEAKANGVSELKSDKDHLSFAESNGDVVIEDKNHDNEVTVAKDDNGEYKLEGVPSTKAHSATLDDVKSEKPSGTDKAPLAPDSTLKGAKVDDVKNEVTDVDKAGVGKNFSLVIDGFESQEAADQFFSDIVLEDECISFSDKEIEAVADDANEVKKLAERVEGTKDPELAHELKTKAECLKAYSVLAENAGYDMSDLYDAACYYSDYADDVLTLVFSEMDVNEFFSQLDEDEMDAYFSNLDEVESEVLFSAMEADEVVTFSDVQDEVDAIYSELELEESVSDAYYSDPEAVESMFSELTDAEANIVFSVLDADEDATFSDINEALDLAYTPMTELFSEMDDEDIVTFSEQIGEDVADIAFSMACDEDENYTYSDFLDVVEYMSTYSEEDVDQLAKNAEEIGKATKDMEASKDAELAKKVKVLADATAEEAQKAEECGVEGAGEIKEKCHSYSDKAEKVLVEKGIDPSSVKAEDVKLDEPKEGEGKKSEGEKSEGKESGKQFSYLFSDENKLFSDSQVEVGKYITPVVNSCFKSQFN